MTHIFQRQIKRFLVEESVNLREEQVTRVKQVIIRSVKLNHHSGGRANKSPGKLKSARASFTINSFQACHHLEEVWLSKQKRKGVKGRLWEHLAALCSQNAVVQSSFIDSQYVRGICRKLWYPTKDGSHLLDSEKLRSGNWTIFW